MIHIFTQMPTKEGAAPAIAPMVIIRQSLKEILEYVNRLNSPYYFSMLRQEEGGNERKTTDVYLLSSVAQDSIVNVFQVSSSDLFLFSHG